MTEDGPRQVMNKNSNSLTFDNSEVIVIEQSDFNSKLREVSGRGSGAVRNISKQHSASSVNIKNTTSLKPPLSRMDSKAGFS